MRSLSSPVADRKTFELVAERGAAQLNLDPLFASLEVDPSGALDAVRDQDNMPFVDEPATVREDRTRIASR